MSMVKKGITGKGKVVASSKDATICPNCNRVVMPDQMKNGICIYCLNKMEEECSS